jgi:hypothetical protein
MMDRTIVNLSTDIGSTHAIKNSPAVLNKYWEKVVAMPESLRGRWREFY